MGRAKVQRSQAVTKLTKRKGICFMKRMNTAAVMLMAVGCLASVSAISAAEVRARTIQYGQGPPVTVFEPVTPRTTIGLYQQGRGLGNGQRASESTKGQWRTFTPPNGGPVSFLKSE
jgi:hypothetical protein